MGARSVRQRIDELERQLPPPTVAATSAFVEERLAAHRRGFDEDGLVLYAGTNAMSAQVQAAHAADLSARSSMGWPAAKYQAGLDELEPLEVAAPRLVAQAVGARHAEVRPHSATMANLAVYTAFTEPGDTIAALPPTAGGHPSHHESGAAGVRGLRVAMLPYDAEALDVDVDALPGFLAVERPRLVVVGASLMLFPHRLAAVAEATKAAGALLVYDASHVAGLVAGGRFQQPLAEGADLLVFSTYKSFGGPAGGVVATDDDALAEAVAHAVYPRLTANHDTARTAPLAVAAAENVEHGADLATRYCANASALAEAADAVGLRLLGAHRGFTESHHVAVDVGKVGGELAMEKLARAGIYLSAIDLPTQRVGEPSHGLRIGVAEVTRRGMTEDDMGTVAGLVAQVLLHDADPVETRGQVRRLRRAVNERTTVGR